MLECRVLGPVQVLTDGVAVEVGGALPRRLLAALALADGKPVSDDRLAQAMWDDQPPAKAAATMQTYVSRLRSALGTTYRDRLGRTSVGYFLHADDLDARRFGELIEAARAQLAGDRPEQARTRLGAALELWRGEPYVELPDDVAGAERGRLAELREVAREDLAAARLGTGDAAEAVVQLEQLVREQPLRERRWALLVVGLYRCDRQGDALATLRKVRELLAEQLGVDPGPELRELEGQVLAHDPRLRLAEPLPVVRPVPIRRPLTTFLGRSADLAVLTVRLDRHRLVNLVGPAGVGKTRLMVEYLGTLGPIADPWVARLADVPDGSGVAAAVADAIGVVAVGDPVAAIVAGVGTAPALLVLDNCEHVVAAAAELVDVLAQSCPGLRILATSREPLGVDGEVTVSVQPLPWTTDSGEPAVELLIDRVRAVRPGWEANPGELAAARRIAVALDGLPLAIELAAARARVLGLGEIADRLDDRFAVLGPVPRGSLAWHATLEAAIAWSVDLLEPADRELLLRLWAFEGGFTLEAAETIWPDRAAAVLESLSALVTRSVVVADTSVEPTRYVLLESIRAYCRAIDPDPVETRLVQARWVRMLAARCADSVRSTQAGAFVRMMSRELPNLRAGFAHDLETDPSAALLTAVSLGVYLYRGVHHGEAIRMLRAGLDAAPEASVLDRIRALNALTALTYFSGDQAAMVQLVEEVLALMPQLAADTAPRDYAEALFFLSIGCVLGSPLEVAQQVTNQLIEYCEQSGVELMIPAAMSVRTAALLRHATKPSDQLRYADELQQHSRGWNKGWANQMVGELYLRHPELAADSADRALAALRVALARFLQHEDYPYALNTLRIGALALVRAGGSAADGALLLAAVQLHAARLGLTTPGLYVVGEPWVEQEVAPPVAADPISWQAMVALLAD
ncbi:AfsR/SARP family transcriptional regulator [Kribbella sandramycini]|uniref:AfsR/SARP family transcriptional regulator n=1 Tax=Kribbella sandramycini TaxID=60450 RepID=A0A7Y4L9N8_9ACTN|nr:putative ATPase/DNA-binding SARP family transcriptional activator [Kribbella sandramycini]NOL45926.1 AfsR/SARP family transcriptional regulator [Kribbella sandramycini]